jgi:hypothetical protein
MTDRRSCIPGRVKAGVLALAVTALSGYGVASANNNVPPAPPRDDTSVATKAWGRLDAKQKAEALRRLDPVKAKGMKAFMEQLEAGGSVPVAMNGRVIGYVEAAALDTNTMPTSKDDLKVIKNKRGRIVGYWGGPLGVLDCNEVERGLDLVALAAKRGLNPDGTVIEDLLRQVPVAPVTVPPPVSEVPIPPR